MNKEHIRHVLMITVEDAKTAAKWNNELQKLAESMPHGIPVNISSDPRNGARGSGSVEFKTAGSDAPSRAGCALSIRSVKILK